MTPNPSLQTLLDYVWIIICAALVFMMQAGFMCLESGLASAKNSINIAIKNLADFIVASILFWAVGFGIMFGTDIHGIFGGSDFFPSIADPWTAVVFTFQVVFAGTSATIVSGAISGRTRFSGYLIISAVISGLIYPVFGHWAWGGLFHGQNGWLQALGFKDFAGSTVVHSVGAWISLASIIVIGPRISKFGEDGTVNQFPPHNMTFAYLGGFILLFGWFGFNCGSTMKASLASGQIAVNTLLSGCFGCVTCAALSWIGSPLKRPTGEMIVNGLLGGLVGVTAGCAYFSAWGAVATGAVSGIIVYAGCGFVEKTLKLDDVVSAVTVHGFCGAWGTIAVAIFILPEHLAPMTRFAQFKIQLLGVIACFAWTFGLGIIILKFVDRFTGGLRVSREAELMGLNISEHGASSSLLDLIENIRNATVRGDFSSAKKVEVEVGTEIGDLAAGFNRMVDAIQQAFTETQSQMETARTASVKAETAQEALIQSRSKYQARIREIADAIGGVMSETEQALNTIESQGSHVVANINDLMDLSKAINAILKMINDISMSTKLIAFNALIEAAHAGNHGKSFAVVARNLKDLSQQTGDATNKISGITTSIHQRLERSLHSVQDQYASIRDGKSKILEAVRLTHALLDETLAAENV